MNEQLLLRMENISKSFPGVQALDRVNFDLAAGEVHALVGENGAGKSTLMKVLAGIYSADQGNIILHGQPIEIVSPLQAQRSGISIVHQEPSLFPSMTVAENILVGQEPTSLRPLELLNRSQLHAKAHQYLDYFDKSISPKLPLYRLSVAQQQIVEICKALSLQADILILDEPTSSLSDSETERLFDIIEQLRQQGIAIVYISHRLNEVTRLAERVTVLRDGKHVGTLAKNDIDTPKIINMMVGRELSDLYGSLPQSIQVKERVLELKNLSGAGFRDISLSVYKGEIVGLTGLIGSGRTEVGLTLFGRLCARQGQMTLNGKHYRPQDTYQAMKAGVAYVPEDRRKLGLFFTMSVCRNLTATQLEKLDTYGMLSPQNERRLARKLVDQLGIRTPSVEHPVLNLSGGNQQKTMLGKWLATSPKLLIVDEPTRGVDVGAKKEIYAILRSLAASGVGVLMISSEMPEVIGMCERVYVMHEQTLQGELIAEMITEQNIMTLASGHPIETHAIY